MMAVNLTVLREICVSSERTSTCTSIFSHVCARCSVAVHQHFELRWWRRLWLQAEWLHACYVRLAPVPCFGQGKKISFLVLQLQVVLHLISCHEYLASLFHKCAAAKGDARLFSWYINAKAKRQFVNCDGSKPWSSTCLVGHCAHDNQHEFVLLVGGPVLTSLVACFLDKFCIEMFVNVLLVTHQGMVKGWVLLLDERKKMGRWSPCGKRLLCFHITCGP